jgi:hypothetical protein
MATSNNTSTRENNNREVKQSRSSLIVKMPPHARVKKSKLGVRIKRTRVKRSKKISFRKPLSFNAAEPDNEDTIPSDDASVDEDALEENIIAEIISILEHARSRSYGTEDYEETYPESSLNSNVMKTQQKKIPKKYY